MDTYIRGDRGISRVIEISCYSRRSVHRNIVVQSWYIVTYRAYRNPSVLDRVRLRASSAGVVKIVKDRSIVKDRAIVKDLIRSVHLIIHGDRGRSWEFVTYRGLSWFIVVYRGLSWTIYV